MAAPKGNSYYKLAEGWGKGAERAYQPDALLVKFVEYVKWVEENQIIEPQLLRNGKAAKLPKHRPMTIEGLCVFANITTTTFREYEKNEAYLAIVTRIRDMIRMNKLEGAAVGLFNSSIIARELQLVDRSEVSVSQERVIKGMTKEQIAEVLQDE